MLVSRNFHSLQFRIPDCGTRVANSPWNNIAQLVDTICALLPCRRLLPASLIPWMPLRVYHNMPNWRTAACIMHSVTEAVYQFDFIVVRQRRSVVGLWHTRLICGHQSEADTTESCSDVPSQQSASHVEMLVRAESTSSALPPPRTTRPKCQTVVHISSMQLKPLGRSFPKNEAIFPNSRYIPVPSLPSVPLPDWKERRSSFSGMGRSRSYPRWIISNKYYRRLSRYEAQTVFKKKQKKCVRGTPVYVPLPKFYEKNCFLTWNFTGCCVMAKHDF